MTANARERAAATAAKGVKRRDLSGDMIQSAEKQLRKYANLRCSADQLRIFEAVCFALAALTSGIPGILLFFENAERAQKFKLLWFQFRGL